MILEIARIQYSLPLSLRSHDINLLNACQTVLHYPKICYEKTNVIGVSPFALQAEVACLAGAPDPGSCSLCPPGTYLTGSGWRSFWTMLTQHSSCSICQSLSTHWWARHSQFASIFKFQNSRLELINSHLKSGAQCQQVLYTQWKSRLWTSFRVFNFITHSLPSIDGWTLANVVHTELQPRCCSTAHFKSCTASCSCR